MSAFSIRNPYLIIVICLAVVVLGAVAVLGMPVDLFPAINLPQVVVATFYSGMPPQDIEANITAPLERFFTLASGIDHMESHSILGVSMIRVFFQSNTSADADVTQLSNLALADMKRLPPGTLPPVVLKSDASSLPVALVAVKGAGLSETQLHDFAQFAIRNQIVTVPGVSIPATFGGKYRQIMIHVDPYKLFSRDLSVMDVVNAVNNQNLILPAGDVKMGPYDYYIYSNSLVGNMSELNDVPLKTVGGSWVRVGDVGNAEDASATQYNIVRVAGQKSSYIPILKQGGDTNTIQVVNGVRAVIGHLFDIPKEMSADLLFDQSVFVKEAINTVLHETLIGLGLTSILILLFLGNFRATTAVLLSIPISALATFIILNLGNATINTMILGGLALAFSRVIDNSVISIENIFRHLEMGESPAVAAQAGASEVTLAVLAATLVAVVDFFPVTLLFGVSKFLFSALALSFCIALVLSFIVAITVIPLFCSRYLKPVSHGYGERPGQKLPWGARFNASFNRGFNRMLNAYERLVRRATAFPIATVALLTGAFAVSLGLFPLLGLSFFPRSDAGQFSINLKTPTGSRIELTNEYVSRVEDLIKHVISPADFRITVSNIGVVNDLSSLYTTNSGEYQATIQTQLTDDHRTSSFEYMDRIQRAIHEQFPELRTFIQSGSMVDAVLNTGMPAPIDVQVTSSDLPGDFRLAQQLASRISKIDNVSQVYIPQDMDYPGLRMEVDRVHAAELGLTQKEIVDNVITALNSNAMIAPNYWSDKASGNNYLLTVQYYENGGASIRNPLDLRNIPLRAPGLKQPTTLDTVVKMVNLRSPTAVDHYQIQRTADVYVTTKSEDLGRVTAAIQDLVASIPHPANMRVNLRGMVLGMQQSFRSFAIGLSLSFALLYLILVAQFRSFIDPVLIMLAIPMGIIGVLVVLVATGTTLNVMSLMGVLMLVGIAASNSILIVDFAHRLRQEGMAVKDAVITSCRVRLRPILMTSLATILGMIPMALKLGTGAEQYAPMAQAIIGGLSASVILTIFIVPAAYVLIYRRRETTVSNV